MTSQSFCSCMTDQTTLLPLWFVLWLVIARSLCFCVVWFVPSMVSSAPVLQVVLSLGGQRINCSDALRSSAAWLWNSSTALRMLYNFRAVHTLVESVSHALESPWRCSLALHPAVSPREGPSQICCWCEPTAFGCRGKACVTSLVL